PIKPPLRPPATRSLPLFDGRTADRWRIEHDPVSLAALDIAPALGGTELRLRYGLAGDGQLRPYVALYADTASGIASYDRVAITARAEHPMRISVQLRVNRPLAERWHASVYVAALDPDPT